MDKATCCDNFNEVLDFSKIMITTLSSIPADQSYSVVGFANEAAYAVDRSVMTPLNALDVLDELTYTGGKTNHADAINSCRESLLSASNGQEDSKNLILLITDGDPSEPGGKEAALVSAEEAAEEAKANGVSIIPVMIVPEIATSGLNPDTVVYLKAISSDNSLFEVDSFDALRTLSGSLLEQISCQV